MARTHKGFSANECKWKRYVYSIPGDPAAVRAACLHLCGFAGPLWSGGGGAGGEAGGEGGGEGRAEGGTAGGVGVG